MHTFSHQQEYVDQGSLKSYDCNCATDSAQDDPGRDIYSCLRWVRFMFIHHVAVLLLLVLQCFSSLLTFFVLTCNTCVLFVVNLFCFATVVWSRNIWISDKCMHYHNTETEGPVTITEKKKKLVLFCQACKPKCCLTPPNRYSFTSFPLVGKLTLRKVFGKEIILKLLPSEVFSL